MTAKIQRYVPVGERTIMVAEGIYLYAQVQNLPVRELVGSEAARKWNEWSARYGQEMTDFVRNEQFNLFDRVNARF
jgi:hypothetical protein